jgi:tryptophan 7-halogenase
MMTRTNDTDRSDTERQPVRRVVIAGGGTAGWMAAAALSRTLGKVLDITLVESDAIGTVGVGEATIPTLVAFHRLLNINEQEFMAATHATFKLGIQFESWRDRGEDYFHSFGTTGRDHWTAGFQHFWLEGRKRGLAGEYGAYCLELRAAMAGRFAQLPNHGINYAYHIDSTRYARFLRRFSEGYGLKRVEGLIERVEKAANGDIAALILKDGTRIEGDLFIDCTGFRALLIGQALGVEFEDWSHWLFTDGAFTVQTETVRDAVPYTRSIAGDACWQWRIPLQHRVGNGIVFSSRYMDEDTARKTLMDAIEGTPRTEPRLIRFKPGQRKRCWERNCVALGLSSGFLEPLESTNIHLIQRGISRLLKTFPSVINDVDIAEYNAQVEAEMTHIRDFVILHYHVTRRRDTAFWRDCADMDITPTLRHRIEHFAETGKVFRSSDELFAENSWIQVMMGQGLMPRNHHVSPSIMDDGELKNFLDGVSGKIEQTVSRLPSHMDFIRSFCPMPEPAAG